METLTETFIDQSRPTVYAKGIKKRCRKIDTHGFTLGYLSYPLTEAQKADLVEKAKVEVKANIRGVPTKVWLVINHVQVDCSRGYEVVRMVLFSNKHETIAIDME